MQGTWSGPTMDHVPEEAMTVLPGEESTVNRGAGEHRGILGQCHGRTFYFSLSCLPNPSPDPRQTQKSSWQTDQRADKMEGASPLNQVRNSEFR